MGGRPLTLGPAWPPGVATAGVLAAALVGALLAVDVPLGIGLLLGLLYAPLVLVDLPLGIAAWVGLISIQYLPVVSIGPNAASLLILVAWFGVAAGNRAAMLRAAARHRVLLAGLALLLVWLTLSAAWAERPAAVLLDVWQWYLAALVLLVVGSALPRERDVRLVVLGFVLGALLSVSIGLAESGLAAGGNAVETATRTEGRLQGGGGDPNFLAAGLVPAIALAIALSARGRHPGARFAALPVLAILAVGLTASQSRGGLLAAALALVAAFVLLPGRRAALAAIVAVVLACGGAWFAANPGAWTRVTSTDEGGNGRSDLWSVAWAMFKDHPLTGVGLNNFRVRAPDYVDDLPDLRFADLIVERPHVVHNTYLQLLAETGVVGLLLFLGVVVGALRAGLLAARRFAAAGQRALATLARTLVVGTLGMLCAAFFISAGSDKRLWLLLALGPALLALAPRAPDGDGVPAR